MWGQYNEKEAALLPPRLEQTYSEGQIGSDGDLGAEVDGAVGVADSEHGIARGQGLGSHPTAVVLAGRQPSWMKKHKVGNTVQIGPYEHADIFHCSD